MALTLRSVNVARPAQARAPIRASRPVRSVLVRAEPAVEQKLKDAVKAAEEACSTGSAKDCAVQMEAAEEIAHSISDKKANEVAQGLDDPLEAYCKEAPDADECRVYED